MHRGQPTMRDEGDCESTLRQHWRSRRKQTAAAPADSCHQESIQVTRRRRRPGPSEGQEGPRWLISKLFSLFCLRQITWQRNPDSRSKSTIILTSPPTGALVSSDCTNQYRNWTGLSPYLELFSSKFQNSNLFLESNKFLLVFDYLLFFSYLLLYLLYLYSLF